MNDSHYLELPSGGTIDVCAGDRLGRYEILGFFTAAGPDLVATLHVDHDRDDYRVYRIWQQLDVDNGATTMYELIREGELLDLLPFTTPHVHSREAVR